MPPRIRVGHLPSAPAFDILRHGVRAAGGALVTDDNADVLWSPTPPIGELRRGDLPARRVSHLAGSEALTNKARLGTALTAVRRRVSRLGPAVSMAAHPQTFAMPDQFPDLKLAAAYAPATRWMRRPKVTGTNQRSEPLTDITAAGLDPRWVVQEVIDSAIAFRVPALISSLDPLVVEAWPGAASLNLPDACLASIELTIAERTSDSSSTISRRPSDPGPGRNPGGLVGLWLIWNSSTARTRLSK